MNKEEFEEMESIVKMNKEEFEKEYPHTWEELFMSENKETHIDIYLFTDTLFVDNKFDIDKLDNFITSNGWDIFNKKIDNNHNYSYVLKKDKRLMVLTGNFYDRTELIGSIQIITS